MLHQDQHLARQAAASVAQVEAAAAAAGPNGYALLPGAAAPAAGSLYAAMPPGMLQPAGYGQHVQTLPRDKSKKVCQPGYNVTAAVLTLLTVLSFTVTANAHVRVNTCRARVLTSA